MSLPGTFCQLLFSIFHLLFSVKNASRSAAFKCVSCMSFVSQNLNFYHRVSREMEKNVSRLLLSRKSNFFEKRLTILTPRKSGIRKSHFPTAFLACFSVILSRKMKNPDFRLTFSKKELLNGAICKSYFVISTFTTYLPFILLEKH